jgi:hypothetical protein
MIDHKSGETALKYIIGTDPIILNIKFPHIPKREKVKLVYWMSSNDDKSYKNLIFI